MSFSFDHVITCPKAFRLGAEETMILDLYGYTHGATVSVYVQVIINPGKIFVANLLFMFNESCEVA